MYIMGITYSGENWRRKVVRFVLSDVICSDETKEVRKSFLRFFVQLYESEQLIKEAFSDYKTSDIATMTVEAGHGAKNHNPHKLAEQIIKPVRYMSYIIRIIASLLIIIIFLLPNGVVAIIPSVGVEYSTSNLLLYVISPFAFASVLSYILFWSRILRFNKHAHQLSNNELEISPGFIRRVERTELKKELVSYYFWNSIIKRQHIPFIILGFSILESLSEWPIFGQFINNPTDYMLKSIIEDINIQIE